MWLGTLVHQLFLKRNDEINRSQKPVKATAMFECAMFAISTRNAGSDELRVGLPRPHEI